MDQCIGLAINHLGFCITSYRRIQTNIYPTHYKAGTGDGLCGGDVCQGDAPENGGEDLKGGEGGGQGDIWRRGIAGKCRGPSRGTGASMFEQQ